MELMDALIPALTGVAGAAVTGLGAYYKFVLKGDQQEHTQQQDFIRTLIEETTKLREETRQLRDAVIERDQVIAGLNQRVSELTEKVDELRTELQRYETYQLGGDSAQVLEQILNAHPMPCWLHEVGANAWYINDAYSKIYNVRRRDFWSSVNVLRAYPSERAAHFVKNDMGVVESGIPLVTTETFPRRILEPVDATNPAEETAVVKIPIEVGARKYIFGKCYPPGAPRNLWDALKADD